MNAFERSSGFQESTTIGRGFLWGALFSSALWLIIGTVVWLVLR